MIELINSLLNVSRIDMGVFAIVPEPCDFSEISDSVLAELMPSIKEKNMVIKKDYDKKLGKINADPKLTRILFQNLLSNAVKYTAEKGNIFVSTKKQGDDVLITVKDTGYGIPKKDQPRIFEKLFRADNIRDKETDGTGLGLYIIKSITEQSGGKIWFESEENKGTTFYVRLPLSGMKPKEGTKDLA
jgi:signal transduction histidine kinase